MEKRKPVFREVRMRYDLATRRSVRHGSIAAAQTYPSRPVTLIVGFEPGGGTDTVARVMQKKLGEYLGQTIVVENRAGAGGTIAAGIVAKAEPDGYTFLLATIGALAVEPHLMKLPTTRSRSRAAVDGDRCSGNVLVVHPSVPAKTLADFVKLANRRPGTIAYGTSGVGGAGHLAGELLEMMAHIQSDACTLQGRRSGDERPGRRRRSIPRFRTPITAPAADPERQGAWRSRPPARGAPRPCPTCRPSPSRVIPATRRSTGTPTSCAGEDAAGTSSTRLNTEIVKTLKHPRRSTSAAQKQGEDPHTHRRPRSSAQHMKREYDTWGRVVKQADIKAE